MTTTPTDRAATDARWRAYRSDPSPENRNAVMECYLPFLWREAICLSRRLPRDVGSEADDLAQAAVFALAAAIESFDPERGTTFLTYAKRRVHGAMVDHIRSLEWVQRYGRQRGDSRRHLPMSRELYGHGEGGEASLTGVLADRRTPDPSFAAEQADSVRHLLRRLSPTQAFVVTLYDVLGVELREAGAALGVTASGASLIRRGAMETLRWYLAGEREVSHA